MNSHQRRKFSRVIISNLGGIGAEVVYSRSKPGSKPYVIVGRDSYPKSVMVRRADNRIVSIYSEMLSKP